jgi:hypothetical protein
MWGEAKKGGLMYLQLRIGGLVAGTLLALGFGSSVILATQTVAAGATTATPSPPTIVTSNFVCGTGACAIGPGDVGMPFAAGLIGTGGPQYTGPECNAYLMKVVSGTLPPGLRLGEPICEWVISGTPTHAGTYTFTVQIAPQPNNLGQPAGPSGTQQFAITIGGGSSDRVSLTGAVWSSHNRTLQVRGFDVNSSATYTVFVTATGTELGTISERTPDSGGDGSLVGNFSESLDPNSLTIRDSLGGSASIPVAVNNRY